MDCGGASQGGGGGASGTTSAGASEAGASGHAGTSGTSGTSGNDGGGPIVPDGGEAGRGGAGEAGAGGQAGSPGCEEGDKRCFVDDAGVTRPAVPQVCHGGSWQSKAPCQDYCNGGSCVSSPSCSGAETKCGPQSDSCCEAIAVPGGKFIRSYDAVYSVDDSFPATVRSFIMDRFEVTVGRFQNFVAVYPANLPKAGAGKSHAPDDMGWDASWPMPASAKDLTDQLACDGGTWQNPPATDPLLEQRPVNCVSFYVAYAFCIWEGGRLPTEAEWNYAAAGGSEQRVYPWSNPHNNSDIGPQNAVYVDDAGSNGLPNVVGSRACVGSMASCGDGLWGHSDLVGNVLEWTLDYYSDPYPSTDCVDCENASAQLFRVMRGGSYKTPLVAVEGAALLSSSYRWSQGPLDSDSSFGFRCVYDLVQ